MKIRLLEVNDWQGLYLNDQLIMEGRSLDLVSVIEVLLPTANFKRKWLDNLDEYGWQCPEFWTDELEG